MPFNFLPSLARHQENLHHSLAQDSLYSVIQRQIPLPHGVRISTNETSTYGEDSRKYRRTVYTHDDWRKHRSSNRLFHNMSTIFSSGVYKSILGYVAATTAVAAFVCIWNANKALPRLVLPLAPFTLSSPSLGLLLVFKTNTGYSRWDEARKNWGSNINRTRDLCRMGSSLYNDKNVSQARRQQDLSTLALCTWAFCRSMKRHLSPADEDEEAFQAELYEKLPTKQAEGIIRAKHRPNRALQDLSTAIENLANALFAQRQATQLCHKV